MVEINLLPWREQKHQYERKIMRHFFLGGLLTALLILAISHYFLNEKINRESQRVEIMKTALQVYAPDGLSAQQKNSLENDGIDTYVMTPAAVMQLLEAATLTTGRGICFKSISREGRAIKLSGEAWSLAALTSSLDGFGKKNVFESIKIDEVKRLNDVFQFKLDAQESKEGREN